MTKYTNARLKPWAQYHSPGSIYFLQERGVGVGVEIFTERQRALIQQLSDGVPLGDASLTADDLAFLESLDELGLLLDEVQGDMQAASSGDLTRYQSNLAFFEAFSTLDWSSAAFHESLREKHVVVLGGGGVGSVVCTQLCGLGIGRLTLVDKDEVELKNLSRQFLYSARDIGRRKVDAAREKLAEVNPDVEMNVVEQYVTDAETLRPILRGADLVISIIDSPEGILYVVNEACVQERVPLVAGGTRITRGVYLSVSPGMSACLECSRAGAKAARPTLEFPGVNRVVAPATGLVGSLIVWEALRYLLDLAPPVSAGRFTEVDFLTGETRGGEPWTLQDACPVCAQAQAAVESEFLGDERRVEIAPYVTFEENGEYFIGSPQTEGHVIVNRTAWTLLEELRLGKTFSQAELNVLRKTGETVDVEDFVDKIRAAGLLRTEARQSTQRLYRLIPRSLARALFGRVAWWIYGAAAVACVLLWWRFPALLPRAQDLTRWTETHWLVLLSFLLSRLQIAVHELAHFTAARAVDVPGRFRISRRLFLLVYETDVSGIWLVPKRQRYSTFLAGMAVDTVSLLIALGLRYAHLRGLVSEAVDQVAALCVLTVFNAFIFQALLFLRTDLYAVMVNAFNCRNLYRTNMLSLKLTVKKLLRQGISATEQAEAAAFHPQDLKALKVFTPVYLLGIVLVTWFMVRVTLPASWIFLERSLGDVRQLAAGGDISLLTLAANVVLIGQVVVQLGLIVFVVLRGLGRALRSASRRIPTPATIPRPLG